MAFVKDLAAILLLSKHGLLAAGFVSNVNNSIENLIIFVFLKLMA